MAFDTKETITDTMRIYYDLSIPMRDGVILKADLFLPLESGQYPALMTYGIYGKGQCFQTVYEGPWTRMVTDFPEIMEYAPSTIRFVPLTMPNSKIEIRLYKKSECHNPAAGTFYREALRMIEHMNATGTLPE
jgi:hypothetical protein